MTVAGRPLTSAELDAYDVLPRDLARRARIHAIAWLPGRYVGITLGRRIFLAQEVADDGTSTLLAHELVHVRQWHELGVVGFTTRYLGDFVTNLRRTRRWHPAYSAIGAEVEARLLATDWLRRHTLADGMAPESAQ